MKLFNCDNIYLSDIFNCISFWKSRRNNTLFWLLYTELIDDRISSSSERALWSNTNPEGHNNPSEQWLDLCSHTFPTRCQIKPCSLLHWTMVSFKFCSELMFNSALSGSDLAETGNYPDIQKGNKTMSVFKGHTRKLLGACSPLVWFSLHPGVLLIAPGQGLYLITPFHRSTFTSH